MSIANCECVIRTGRCEACGSNISDASHVLSAIEHLKVFAGLNKAMSGLIATLDENRADHLEVIRRMWADEPIDAKEASLMSRDLETIVTLMGARANLLGEIHAGLYPVVGTEEAGNDDHVFLATVNLSYARTARRARSLVTQAASAMKILSDYPHIRQNVLDGIPGFAFIMMDGAQPNHQRNGKSNGTPRDNHRGTGAFREGIRSQS